jgi:hypothetical protein
MPLAFLFIALPNLSLGSLIVKRVYPPVYSKIEVKQYFKTPVHKSRVSTFCTVAPNMAWNFLDAILLALSSRIEPGTSCVNRECYSALAKMLECEAWRRGSVTCKVRCMRLLRVDRTLLVQSSEV